MLLVVDFFMVESVLVVEVLVVVSVFEVDVFVINSVFDVDVVRYWVEDFSWFMEIVNFCDRDIVLVVVEVSVFCSEFIDLRSLLMLIKLCFWGVGFVVMVIV